MMVCGVRAFVVDGRLERVGWLVVVSAACRGGAILRCAHDLRQRLHDLCLRGLLVLGMGCSPTACGQVCTRPRDTRSFSRDRAETVGYGRRRR